MSNSNLISTPQKPKFSVAITTEKYQRLINNTLGDPERAKRFIASITSAVAVTPALQDCEAGSLLAVALLGESLNLSPSPQLGQYYIVPFKSKEKRDRAGNLIKPETVTAQFILGYKGYMQLAMRSGQLRKINVIEIKQGELKQYDPLNEEISCMLIDDWDKREKAPTIGYYAFFELINGFRKAIYWSKEKMESHADKYSQAFSRDAYHKVLNGEIPEREMWKYSSQWYTDFDDMAKKTMLRQLISKGGCPMSTELRAAFEKDNSVLSIRNDEIITEPEIQAYDEPQTDNLNESIDNLHESAESVQQISLNDL